MTDLEGEEIIQNLRFIKNRLDRIATDVIEWMPEEDNDRHHNAIECLQAAFQVAESLQERVAIEYNEAIRPEGRYWLQDDFTHLGGHNLLPDGERSYT